MLALLSGSHGLWGGKLGLPRRHTFLKKSMIILNLTKLRAVAMVNGWSDQWRYSINGTIATEPVKIVEVPREGTVFVSNANNPDTAEAAWICFRYPGYKTPEEIAEAEEARRRLTSSLSRCWSGYEPRT